MFVSGMTHARMAGFDDPLEMLAACHDRIRAHCETLRRLARHLTENGCDIQARQAAAGVLRYFDTAGRHHHEDEERDLFPRMRASATGETAVRVAGMIAQLEREHDSMNGFWSDVRTGLERIARGERAVLDVRALRSFCGVYNAHIAFEEANIIPLATTLLAPAALSDIGAAMARRRGVPIPGKFAVLTERKVDHVQKHTVAG